MYKLKSYIYIRKDKVDKDNMAPVYLRIIENGSRAEIYLKVKVSPDQWNQEAQRASDREVLVNNRIEDALSKINRIERKYIDQSPPSLEQVKREFNGENKQKFYYIEQWDKFIKEIENNIGSRYSEGTLKKYKTTRKHFKRFLERYYRKSDIELEEVSVDLINSYFSYLRNDLSFRHNTVVRYVKNTKVIFNRAIKRGWISSDPFIELDLVYESTQRTCLSHSELKNIEEKEIAIERLAKIRDYFLFSCYTGLRFSDISRLKKRHIQKNKGKYIITLKTKKTEKTSYIPVLNTAEFILNKYNWQEKENDECIFNIPSNQKYNAYLKEIADVCSIDKHLTTHVARHTFATTVTLEKGISLESVSHMLGHSQLRTTQIYSKVTEKKVVNEMNKIFNK